ncbi:MAG: hypothetical protein IT210_11440 [Armatimonadetes bacterium]|nr:hypothetical protein [Armatimonadota bacterium]
MVVRGEPTATAHFQRWTTDADAARRQEPAQGGVSLAAVQEMGKGRIALIGLPQTYSFAAPYLFPGADIALYAGLDGQPSGGRKILINLLRWLSEPSLKEGMKDPEGAEYFVVSDCTDGPDPAVWYLDVHSEEPAVSREGESVAVRFPGIRQERFGVGLDVVFAAPKNPPIDIVKGIIENDFGFPAAAGSPLPGSSLLGTDMAVSSSTARAGTSSDHLSSEWSGAGKASNSPDLWPLCASVLSKSL